MSQTTDSEVNLIVDAIRAGKFTNSQLVEIITAVKSARADLAEQIRSSLQLGQAVKFKVNDDVKLAGTVVKVAVKYVTVDTQQGRFRVPTPIIES